VIPVNRIRIADRADNGDINLVSVSEYDGSIAERRSALQPVLDALQIKPITFDLIDKKISILTEGIYDYFALELFRAARDIRIIPSVGADSIKFYISLMIAWQIDFRALWDNDTTGRENREKAEVYFGKEIAKKHLKLLPDTKTGGRRIMQDLFDGQDLLLVRTQLHLPPNSSYERTLHALFYSPDRVQLLTSVGSRTRENFDQLFAHLELD
jgi:hypothetical protein